MGNLELDQLFLEREKLNGGIPKPNPNPNPKPGPDPEPDPNPNPDPDPDPDQVGAIFFDPSFPEAYHAVKLVPGPALAAILAVGLTLRPDTAE